MNVLVIGSGGREHALALKLSQSKELSKLYCCPGNPGTGSFAENISADISDFDAIAGIISDKSVDLVLAGPEEPLVKGLRDYLESIPDLKNVRFVGPDKRGAMLEGSKDFAKGFMSKYYIPTANYRSFGKDEMTGALKFLKTLSAPYVLKADGLAAGKGVLICETLEEAERGLETIFGGKFGSAGETVVIEEFLKGIELSVFILTDGKDYLVLPEAKDYKRIFDGDNGLNTGGMGAVSPVPFADEVFMQKVEDRIIKPAVKGLGSEGIKYNGFLFIGLMNCNGDPYVIEFNVRMGDPETEAVVPRIKSDLLGHMVAMCDGRLSGEKIEIINKQALTVVCVSGGYPAEYLKGITINGLSNTSGCMVYHSGTKMSGDNLVTNGGRVLAVTVFADDIESARESVYAEIDKIEFEGIHFRKDIGCDLL